LERRRALGEVELRPAQGDAMQVVITGRHMSVTEAMKKYAEEKSQKLLKYFNRINEIRMILDLEGGKPTCEGIVEVEHAEDLVASKTDNDMYAAIDMVSAKLETQIRKHKEFISQRHKGRLGEGKAAGEEEKEA
jgi:putative sigma-54 modulation protein